MERDKGKQSSSKGFETGRGSISGKSSVKIFKEKLVREDLDASQFSSNLPKAEQNSSLLSSTSPINTKVIEEKAIIKNVSLVNTPEIAKSEFNVDKVSGHSSQENFFVPGSTSQATIPVSQILLASPSNMNSQVSPTQGANNLQPSPIISAASLKSKKKENPPTSPKMSLNKDVNKDSKGLKSTTSPKSYLKIRTDKEKLKKKTTMPPSNESPGKDLPARNSFVNTSQENIQDSECLTQSALSQQTPKYSGGEFVKYYKQERPKLNIWTYLFKNLNSAISQIYTMCDMENSVEFNNGVISTLETALEDMRKLNKKIEIDNINEDKKALVWEIPGTSLEIQNKQEIENFLEDAEDPDTVDFTLLTQLIQDGTMSLQEAIVLLVRERALLLDDNAINILTNSQGINSDNLSFTSKINPDFSIEYQKEPKDSKDSKEDSLIPPFQIVDDGQELLRRSRSQTPGRISLVRLINRLNWKLQEKKKDTDEGDNSEDDGVEEHKNKLRQKQLNAEQKRKERESLKQDTLQKEFNKINEAREKLANQQMNQQMKKLEAFSKKLEEAEERYEAKLSEKRKKAKNESDKVNEVAFISLLEKQTKKLTLDLKVKETRERRLQIIEQIKQKQMGRSLKEDAVLKRRAAQQKESEGKLKSKLEEAENRRNKIFEERKKVLGEESKKLTDATKRKKIMSYKDLHMKKGEESTHKSRVSRLKAVLSEEQEKLDKLLKKDPRATQMAAKLTRKKSSIIDNSSDEDMSFVIMKRSKSARTEDDDGDIVLEDQPIVFYEPKSKLKAKQMQEEQLALQRQVENAKKGKKKKKKKETGIPKDEEEDKFKTILALIKSFSQPNLRTPKLKDLSLKLELADEKEVVEEKKTTTSTATGSKASSKLATPVSSSTAKKLEKQEPATTKSSKDLKDKDAKGAAKHAENEATSRKAPTTKVKTTTGTDATTTEKGTKGSGNNPTPVSLKKERTSITDKEETSIETAEGTAGSKDKDTCGGSAEKVTEQVEEKEGSLGKVKGEKEGDEEGKGAELGEDKEDKMFRWCSICDLILEGETGNEEHIGSKQHRKVKTQYNLSNSDDSNCILEFKTSERNSKLKAERLNTLKKRCKKIKQRLVTRALKKESTIIMGKDKEVASANKQRLQKLCLELDKQVATQIKDYDIVDNILKDFLKLLDNQKEADLHIMRQLKFIPILMEICKRVSVCHKNEQDALLRALDSAIKILAKFCGLIDNRTYMIVTNRLVPLIDLLIWCLNRPTKFVYSLSFVPHLFTLLGRHLNHRMHFENEGYKEDIIEYIFCSGLLVKLQQKFMSFNGGLDLTTSMGKVPLALLKSVSFLEILTSVVDVEFNAERSIFDPINVNENILIASKETEFIGMFSLLASLLLSDSSYIKQPTKILPQTVLSVAMTTVKFFNNIARIMLEPFQLLLGSKDLQEQVYHVFHYLLTYCNQNYDSSEDVKDLLDELILMIGYFCVLNPVNQEILGKGMTTLVQKLTDLPFPYFTDKKMKDILFPTLFCAVFKSERNLELVYKDVTREHLDKYLQSQIQLFPLEPITEKEEGHLTPSNQESTLTLGPNGSLLNSDTLRTNKFLRAPSISSNTSSTTSLFNVKSSNSHNFLLICRFPRDRWDELLKFINAEPETGKA